MREIKFRGKSFGGTWYYGWPVKNATGQTFIQWVDTHFDAPVVDNERVMPETISQFAGLKDCEGHDIYEGDVLTFRFPALFLAMYPIAKGVVCFESGEFMVKDPWHLFILSHIISEAKIIGNIHDNPKLMEVPKC